MEHRSDPEDAPMEIPKATTAETETETETEPAPDTNTADISAQHTTDASEIERLIAEAEERGYMRGRNERIAEQMNSPALWENDLRHESADKMTADADYEALLLTDLRPGVWD